MPLYNCFSDRVCPRLDLRFNVRHDDGYVAEFSTADRGYKIYMVPVRLFKDYTIAIDSEDAVEMCCGLFGQYQYESDYDVIAKNTYACFSSMQFKTPVLYEGVRSLDALSKLTSVPELAQHEDDLKLFIKIPAKNKSSIVILEGDYTKYNDSVACRYAGEESTTVLRKQMPQTLRTQPKYVLERLGYVRDANGNDGKKATNHSVINFEYDCESLANKLITPLQLLKFNTGVSYPFADRLIEYLVGNAVTPMDEIGDNVKRVKTVVGKNLNKDVLKLNDEDVWEAPMRLVLYDYINDKYNVDDVNHDILGFVDKDVEKLYSASTGDSVDTIASVDIYDDWED